MRREDELREINEAISAGQYALSAINEAEQHLGNARAAGAWDIFGGGLISGLVKHSQMDKAQDSVDRAREALQKFQQELQDINMNINYAVKFDGATKAIDILFDNFFVDAMIQSRIKDTQENIKQTRYQVEQALERLRKMKESLV